MANRILVPLDGSSFSEQALEPAADIARRTGATLELATAYQSQMPAWRTSGAPVHDPRVDQELVAALKQYLEQVAARIAQELDVGASGVLLYGPPAEMLARHIAERPPLLVVMTTHGRGGLSRAWLGSVAEELMRVSDAPVLAFRPREGERLGSFAPRRILVPLDGSERAERVLENAAWLAAREGAHFTLLRIVTPAAQTPYPNTFPAPTPGSVEEAVAVARDTLGAAASRLSARGFDVDARVAAEANVAKAILAASEDMDLIAVAAHGFEQVRRQPLGKVAERVVRGAHVPVLLRRG